MLLSIRYTNANKESDHTEQVSWQKMWCVDGTKDVLQLQGAKRLRGKYHGYCYRIMTLGRKNPSAIFYFPGGISTKISQNFFVGKS